MKQDFKKIIREEVRKALKEEASFGDQIEKEMSAKILADKRAFQAWAKAGAAKKKVYISFQGPMLIRAALTALYNADILTDKVISKWQSAPADSKEGQLFSGLTALAIAANP